MEVYMSNQSSPSPIREYYIAYFDILGYRQFFMDAPEQAENLLMNIHNAITNVKNNITASSNSGYFKDYINIELKVKIFSDNIFVCLEKGDDLRTEKARAIFFLEIISEIQRDFIINHNLFLRGGITLGNVSYNEDYIFGDGLIEAVNIEETTVYPRIVLSKSLFLLLSNIMSYTSEEGEKAITIETRINNKEIITQEDEDFYNFMLRLANAELFLTRVFYYLTSKCYDEEICISYLYKFNPTDYVNFTTLSEILNQLKNVSPKLYEIMNGSLSNMLNGIDDMLSNHKVLVEEQIKKYGNYVDLKLDDRKKALQRERVLKKYVWVMKYHNDMCCKYNKMQYFIETRANCDARFMLLTVNLL